MDIGGVGRIKTLPPQVNVEIRKNDTTQADRDAQGNSGYQNQAKSIMLTSEQEEEALKKLLTLPAFHNAGLAARIVREEGKTPHITVLNAEGMIVRRLPYQQIVDLFLDRKSEATTGRLLKQVA